MDIVSDARIIDFFIMGLLAIVLYLYVIPKIKRLKRGNVNYMSPQELKKRIDNEEDILVVDIRSAREFNSLLGHVEGALNIPFHDLVQKLYDNETRLRKYKDVPIVIVAYKDGNEGFLAYKTFLNKEFSNVFLLDNGITAWVRSGYPVFRDEPNGE